MATVKEIIANTKMEMEINGDNKFYSYILTDIEKAYEKEIAEKDKEIELWKIIYKEENRIKSDFIKIVGKYEKNQLYKEDFKKVDHYNRCDGNCCYPKKCDGKGTSWFTYELKDNSQWDKLESKEEKEDE